MSDQRDLSADDGSSRSFGRCASPTHAHTSCFVAQSFDGSSNGDPGVINHLQELANDMKQLHMSTDYSDAVLLVDAHKFPVHKCILAARSEYFRALFYGGLREAQQSEIVINDVSVGTFCVLLRYIYTAQMNLTDLSHERVLDILSAAHQYGFERLETHVAHHLQRIVSTDNVCAIYDAAAMFRLTDLQECCRCHMERHTCEVLQHPSFCQLSPASVHDLLSCDSFYAPELEIFEAVRRWVAANPSADQSDIVAAVRLPLIDLEDLVGCVRKCSIVEPDCILDAVREQLESRNSNLKHRGRLYLDENVCTVGLGARPSRGDMMHNLLNGNFSSYSMEHGFTRSTIDTHTPGVDDCIQVQLAAPFVINHIRFLLWDRDSRSYSYRVLVSIDGLDWVTVADYSRFLCRSWQFIYFAPRPVRHIRLVGTHNTVNRMFHVVSLEAYYSSDPEPVHDMFIAPRANVATLSKSAVVVEGVSRCRHALINGDTERYDWDHGYTCHQLGSGCIIVQLGQPVLVDSMRLLLWDCDDRLYGYYVEVSTDQRHWQLVCDHSAAASRRSWQYISFSRRPVVFVRIVGTHNTANEVFHCVHFECPMRACDRTAQHGDGTADMADKSALDCGGEDNASDDNSGHNAS